MCTAHDRLLCPEVGPVSLYPRTLPAVGGETSVCVCVPMCIHTYFISVCVPMYVTIGHTIVPALFL